MKRSVRILLQLCTIGLLLSRSLFSQTDEFNEPWRLVSFTKEEGLASNHILDVAEAQNGTVWAATSAGLAWYDGYFWHPVDSAHGLPQSPCSYLVPDCRRGVLAIIANQLYRGDESGFTKIPIADPHCMASLPDSSVLIHTEYTSSFSLYLYQHDSLRDFQPMHELTHNKTGSLFQTSAGSIWINTLSGLYRWETDHWRCRLPANGKPFSVNYLEENEEGNGFASLSSSSRPLGTVEWRRNGPLSRSSAHPTIDLTSVSIDSSGDLMGITRAGGARFRHAGRWADVPLFQYQLKKIEHVRFRKNGDLWICTANGLYLYKRSSRRWTNLLQPTPAENIIAEILFTRNGEMWVGTGGGITVYRPDGTRQFIRRILGSPLYDITGLCEDDGGHIWISSGGAFQGVYRWDGRGWSHLRLGDDSERVWIHKIRKDREGRLWFLGMSRQEFNLGSRQPGVFVLEGGRFSRIRESDGLLSGRVYAFAEGREGARWFGTYRGISRLAQGRWTQWTTSQGLPTNSIFTMTIDSDDVLWFADRRHGIGSIGHDDTVHLLGPSDGLIGDQVWDLNTADDGTLWMSSKTGVCSYRRGVFSCFDSKTGLSQSEAWPIVAHGGRIYIGTKGNGLAILDTREDTTHLPLIVPGKPVSDTGTTLIRWRASSYWQEQPPEEIEVRYRLDNRQWSSWSTKREVALNNLSAKEHAFEIQGKSLFGKLTPVVPLSFTIPVPFYGQPEFFIPTSVLSISFIILLTNTIARRRKHAVMLRQSEAKFRRLTEAAFEGIIIHEGGTILDVNQSALDLFGYTAPEMLGKSLMQFVTQQSSPVLLKQLQAASESPCELCGRRKDGSTLTIEMIGKAIPYDGRRAHVVSMRDITYRKLAEERVMTYQQQLQSLAAQLSKTEERERRNMSSFLHDNIGHTLAIAKMKLGSAGSTVFNPKHLDEIRHLVEDALEHTRSLTFELSPPVIHELPFNEAIEWLVENGQEKYDLLIYFEDDGKEKTVPDDLRTFLYHAVRELIVNVVKHSESRSAEVGLQREGDQLVITVRDEGKGFDPSLLANQMKNSSFGLFHIRERISHYGGTLEIESEPAKGTVARLRVPLTNTLNRRQEP